MRASETFVIAGHSPYLSHRSPLKLFESHANPRWSPHHADILASSGYDMTARVWSTRPPGARRITSAHTEFTMALGWALFEENELATAGWDQDVFVYRPAF